MSERATAGSTPAPRSATVRQRLVGALIRGASVVACRLPESPLIALAELGGELWFRADRHRAERGRRNFRRVAQWLVANDLASPLARRAATDDRALERFVRLASRHHARYYLEVLRTPGYSPERVGRMVRFEDEAGAEGALAQTGAVIVIGLHFASLEIPAIFLADHFRRLAVVPMETLADPVLQAWFERTRSGVGLKLVPLSAARSAIFDALAQGGIAGIVADRDIHGGGVEVPFFGHPAPLPIGAALASIESGAPAYVMGARRDGVGRYRGTITRIPIPTEGRLRERVTAFLTAQAAAYEQVIATAPEQWWSAFLPVWRDVERDLADATGVRSTATFQENAS